MAWLDDRLWCHPKLADVSDGAFRAYVQSIAYSSGFGTGGGLTEGQQRLVGGTVEIRDELVVAGLWDQGVGDSIVVHDWHEHNGKRDARREADKERKRLLRGGLSTLPSAGQSAGHTNGRSAGPAHVDGSEGSDGSEESKSNSGVEEVYDHWRSERGKTNARYDRISDGRRAKIRARLKEFSVDDLKQAITNVALDPWDGRAQNDDLTILLRNQEQVEKFLEMAGSTEAEIDYPWIPGFEPKAAT